MNFLKCKTIYWVITKQKLPLWNEASDKNLSLVTQVTDGFTGNDIIFREKSYERKFIIFNNVSNFHFKVSLPFILVTPLHKKKSNTIF